MILPSRSNVQKWLAQLGYMQPSHDVLPRSLLLKSMLLVRTQRHFPLIFRSILHLPLIKKVCRKNLSNSTTQAEDMETVNTTERLRKLRDLMKENRLDLYSMIRE